MFSFISSSERTYKPKFTVKILDTKNLKESFSLDDTKSNQYSNIINLFEVIQKSISEKMNQEFENSKFYRCFICILGCALLIFSYFLCVCLTQKIPLNNILFLVFIILIIFGLNFIFLLICQSSTKQMRDYHDSLIICSYQMTALLTAIELDDKETILKIVNSLSEIDQSFFNKKNLNID